MVASWAFRSDFPGYSSNRLRICRTGATVAFALRSTQCCVVMPGCLALEKARHRSDGSPPTLPLTSLSVSAPNRKGFASETSALHEACSSSFIHLIHVLQNAPLH